MKIILCDINRELTAEFERFFAGVENVEVHTSDIFEHKADAIVSPANSFGFMDGGIDAVYSEHFGWDLQDRLQETIVEKHDGEVLVGQAVIIPTKNQEIPWLISAPTMRAPQHVDGTVNAYLAFRAALKAVAKHNAQEPRICALTGMAHYQPQIKSILCPGLGTAVGNMNFAVCAAQMRAAYNETMTPRTFPQSILSAYHHNKMLIKGVI
jgi:O-acetyl-ADP-ribose deacetylase (regulator of RNase III)